MKSLKLNRFVAIALLLVLFAFTAPTGGGIQGKVLPAEGAEVAIAISGRDTLSTRVNNGNFVFRGVKARTYKIQVKGIPPYKDTSVENVAVIDGAITDIGVVSLLQ